MLELTQRARTAAGEIAFDSFGEGPPVVLVHGTPNATSKRIALIDAVVLAPWITPRTRQMQSERERYRELPDEELAASIREHLERATAEPLDPEAFEGIFGQWRGAEGQALYLRNLACFDEADTLAFEPLLGSLALDQPQAVAEALRRFL